MDMLYLQATIALHGGDGRLSHEYHPSRYGMKYDRGRWLLPRQHRQARGHSCCVVARENMSIDTDRCATREETS